MAIIYSIKSIYFDSIQGLVAKVKDTVLSKWLFDRCVGTPGLFMHVKVVSLLFNYVLGGDDGIVEGGQAGAAAAGGVDVQKKEVDDADVELHCRVEEQKESVDGLKDEVCGRIVEKGHAGLCE